MRAELATMRLAARCGLDVATVERAEALGRDVLLVERFDRRRAATHAWTRRLMISGLTALELDETEAPLASYIDLAGFIRRRGRDARGDCRELYRRMVFNILVGNTDDHARNHAFFWDGAAHDLTPAYDLVPSLRAGRTAFQAMTVGSDGRRATLRNALTQPGQFLLDVAEAQVIVDALTDAVRSGWPEEADAAGLTSAETAALGRETVLGPGCFE